ncbi:MAG: hypothetical protein ACI8ZM_001437 [Crocinitomix sp.]|jgi:hypothetical protein
MKKLLYTIAFICSSASLFAQDFALTYEPNSFEGTVTIRDLATTSDGDLIVGYDYAEAGIPIAGIMKTAPDGSILWSKTLEVPESVAGCSFEVAENAEGNFYLWGLSKTAESRKGAMLSEITPDGELLWTKEYDFGTGITGAYTINSLSVLPSGDLQMMISVYATVIVLQTTSDGEIIWGKVSGMGPPDEGGKNPGFEWLAIPDDGGMCASKAENDFSLLRYGGDGELLWNKAYSLGAYTHCKTISHAPNGNVLIAGYIDYVPHIMEVSEEDGSIVWIKTFEGLTMSFIGKSHLTVDGENIYLDFTTNTNAQYILKMSETGEVLETMMTKNNVMDYNKIEFVDQDEAYFYGSSQVGDTYKGLIVRTQDLFVESCMVGPAEAVYTVDFTDYAEVAFTPTEWEFTAVADVAASLIDHDLRAKFACEVVLSDGPDAALSNVIVYPNPAVNNVTIQITEDLVNATFIMTDLSGKQVMNSTITSLQSEIDLSGLNNGQYILAIQTENGLKTQKITVLK